MFKTEQDLMHAVRLKISELGCTINRINVGKVRMTDGRWFDSGVPKGFSDLQGHTSDGRAIYIETKMHPRHPTKEQCLWLLHCLSCNCRAGVAYSVEEAVAIVTGEVNQEEYLRNELSRYGTPGK